MNASELSSPGENYQKSESMTYQANGPESAKSQFVWGSWERE